MKHNKHKSEAIKRLLSHPQEGDLGGAMADDLDKGLVGDDGDASSLMGDLARMYRPRGGDA